MRLEHGKLLLNGDGVGLRRGERRLLLGQVRGGLLGALLGPGAGPHQVRVALVFLLREIKRTLRLRHLLAGLVDTRGLRVQLRIEICDIGLYLLDLGFGLFQLGLIDRIVEFGQHGARGDDLVVRHIQFADSPGNLRTDRDGPRVDKRIVCRFVLASMQPPEQAKDDGGKYAGNDGGNKPGTLAQIDLPRCFAFSLCQRLVRASMARLPGRFLIVGFCGDASFNLRYTATGSLRVHRLFLEA